jgi:acyl-CoA synthetase (AMP-forming)/AMP-acid ligase II
MEESRTLPELLLRNAQRFDHRKAAIREKDRGIWQTYSWLDALTQVKAFALGLAALGLQRGDKLAIIGDNRPRLYWALSAAQCLGAVPVPLYQDASAKEMQYVLDHSDSCMVVAEDQEQVDKILEVKDKLSKVAYVIYDDPKGMRHYAYPFLLSFTEVQERGRGFRHGHPEYFDEAVRKGQGEDLALINYTSGTTGDPKGAIWTNGTVIWNSIEQVMDYGLRPSHSTYAVIDLYYIGGRHDLTWPILHQGGTVHVRRSGNFDATSVVEYVIEHGITHMLWVPTMLYEILRVPGLAERDTSKLEMIMSGGAPVPRATIEEAEAAFPHTDFVQVYGLTEGGGTVTFVPPEWAKEKIGSCGRPSRDATCSRSCRPAPGRSQSARPGCRGPRRPTRRTAGSRPGSADRPARARTGTGRPPAARRGRWASPGLRCSWCW